MQFYLSLHPASYIEFPKMLDKDNFIGENKGSVNDDQDVGIACPVFQQDSNEKVDPKIRGDQTLTEFSSEAPGPSPEKELLSKRNIWKNLLMISIGFLFNFAAFNALSNIQSSLNSDQGLGTAALSVIYGALVLSCMFVPPALIKRFGCKWSMVMSMLMYSTYIAANFYANWYTLIPTAILVGFGAAPLWGAKCTYLTEIGHQYAKIIGESAETVIVRFFGVFFMFFQSGQVFGNLISSLTLAPPTSQNNFTRDLGICGVNYCNEDLSETILFNASSNVTINMASKPASSQIYTLCGIYLGCSLFGCILIVLFVSPLQRHMTATKDITGSNLMLATFRHMRNLKQILFIPLTIYTGMQQAFISGDFTKAFINCALGIHNVGYVMICFGVVNALCSYTFGHLMKIVGRPFLYIFGASLNIALAITMLHWSPDPSTPIIFFLIIGFWGMADAIWQTQINAFYGVLFSNKSEAAFANFRLWESIGFIIGFLWNNYLCIAIKIYILLGILILGMIGYCAIEITIFLDKKSANVSTTI